MSFCETEQKRLSTSWTHRFFLVSLMKDGTYVSARAAVFAVVELVYELLQLLVRHNLQPHLPGIHDTVWIEDCLDLPHHPEIDFPTFHPHEIGLVQAHSMLA